MNTARVLRQPTDCPVTSEYRTQFKLFDDAANGPGRHLFEHTTNRHPSDSRRVPLFDCGWRIVNGLFELDGIEHAVVLSDRVLVTMASAFDWSELDPHITHLMECADPASCEPKPAPPLAVTSRIRWFDSEAHGCRHYGVTKRLYRPADTLSPDVLSPGMSRTQAGVTAFGTDVIGRLQTVVGGSRLRIGAFYVHVFPAARGGSVGDFHDQIVDVLQSGFTDGVNVENRKMW